MRIDVPTPVALNARLERTHEDRDERFAVLYFGDAEITRWDVTDQRTGFEPQPGDYWTVEDCERHEREWLGEYMARRLAPIFKEA